MNKSAVPSRIDLLDRAARDIQLAEAARTHYAIEELIEEYNACHYPEDDLPPDVTSAGDPQILLRLRQQYMQSHSSKLAVGTQSLFDEVDPALWDLCDFSDASFLADDLDFFAPSSPTVEWEHPLMDCKGSPMDCEHPQVECELPQEGYELSRYGDTIDPALIAPISDFVPKEFLEEMRSMMPGASDVAIRAAWKDRQTMDDPRAPSNIPRRCLLLRGTDDLPFHCPIVPEGSKEPCPAAYHHHPALRAHMDKHYRGRWLCPGLCAQFFHSNTLLRKHLGSTGSQTCKKFWDKGGTYRVTGRPRWEVSGVVMPSLEGKARSERTDLA